MTIRITRNAEGNCVNFIGSSQPAYWNACLSAVVNSDDSNRVNIVNDIRSESDANTKYEFYGVPFSEFADRDGNSFVDTQACIDYINANANVSGVSDTGADLTGVAVNFRLDATSTSVIMDNGSAFGVNTIKAVADVDGTIHIHAIGAGSPDGSEAANVLKHFEKLIHTNVSVNGTAVSGGLQDVANTLNELFTVGAFESVVIADPYSTMIADVAGVDANGALAGSAVNPSNSDIAAGSAAHYNQSGWLSSDTIDQAGEYFSFDIRVEGIIGMGLVVADAADINGNATYGDPTRFCDNSTNSGHYGLQFGHFFHPSPNGPWTNYGANTGYLQGPGWSNVTHRFMSSPEGADWLAGTPVKMRVGLDDMGFISIDYYDVSESVWIACARTTYPTLSGVEYKLGIKLCDSYSRLASLPKIHLLEAAAPTMQFRYIESPDGNYEWPLFTTAEEANYYDLNHSGTVGTGTSHTHTYADDATSTTWYMADTGSTMTDTAAPSGNTFMGNNINWTEITSLTDAQLAPAAFTFDDITREESTAVNLQLHPAGATFSQSVTVAPTTSGLVYNTGNGYLQGTLTDVGADTVYTVTVIRANSYGSTTSTFTITATDVPVASTLLTNWTKAVVMNGSNEYLYQVSNNNSFTPLNMGGVNHTVWGATNGNTSTDTNAKPWSIAQVVYIDNSQPQCYFSQGETSAGDRISLSTYETGANSKIEFYWGRSTGTGGANSNGVQFLFDKPSDGWYGYYIDTTGARFDTANSTTTALGNNLRFKQVDLSTGAVTDIAGTWTVVGDGRMNRAINGSFYLGREFSSSFSTNHSLKVASTLVSTMKRNTLLPNDTEISMQVRDPRQWVVDYRDGTLQRIAFNNNNYSYDTYPERCVSLWLMGDGALDSYSNNIRNDVKTNDQNYTMLRLQNMVSNDIETVNISGLT
mgnify:FL=1